MGMGRSARFSDAVIASALLAAVVGCDGAAPDRGGPDATEVSTPEPTTPDDEASSDPSGNTPDETAATPEDAREETTTDGAAEVALSSVVQVARPEELELGLEGTPIAALRWTDANGDNVAVLSTLPGPDESPFSRELALFADHLVLTDGAERVLRHVVDGVDDCDQDVTAEFLLGTFRVTDVDGDGLGEVTFAYELACRGDVSPAELKLLALEDGAKYIIRGSTWDSSQMRDVGAFEELPDGVPEPAADAWPAALWTQTQELWDEAAIR